VHSGNKFQSIKPVGHRFKRKFGVRFREFRLEKPGLMNGLRKHAEYRRALALRVMRWAEIQFPLFSHVTELSEKTSRLEDLAGDLLGRKNYCGTKGLFRKDNLRSSKLAQLAKKAAEDKKGIDPVILNVGKKSTIASYFLIVNGTSDTHVRAIADNVVKELKKEGERVWHVEGMKEGRWALLDYGDVVIHVFHYETRNFYGLERLWGALDRKKPRARKS